VIDAVGGSSDGRHLGLTAPRKEGQQLAVRRAYEQAGYGPDRVGLVEAHGTGTVVGDRTELATLTETFTDDGAQPGAAVLGSVKSQVGHTKCAAGVVGLVLLRAATLAEAQDRAATLADVAERVSAVDPGGHRHRLRDLA
jgi:acyl transferase domain-containing protein